MVKIVFTKIMSTKKIKKKIEKERKKRKKEKKIHLKKTKQLQKNNTNK